jgi:glycosyltransferase involved in cell wall biosynthesis
MIDEGVQGLLYPPRDVQALTDCICKLQDPGLRREMGAAARRHVLANFSIERMVDDYQEYFGLG